MEATKNLTEYLNTKSDLSIFHGLAEKLFTSAENSKMSEENRIKNYVSAISVGLVEIYIGTRKINMHLYKKCDSYNQRERLGDFTIHNLIAYEDYKKHEQIFLMLEKIQKEQIKYNISELETFDTFYSSYINTLCNEVQKQMELHSHAFELGQVKDCASRVLSDLSHLF